MTQNDHANTEASRELAPQSEAPSVDSLLWELFPCKAPSKCGWALNGNCMCGQSNKRTQAKAKINRLIVLAKLEGFDIAFDCHDYDRLRAYKEQLTKELGDSEAEKNSGTWSRL